MIGRQRGTALLLVLWVTVLVAALLAGLAASARSQAEAALYGSERVRAELAAEAGLAHAVAGLRAPGLHQRWVPDGRPYHFRFDAAAVTVRVVDVGGLFDLNATPTDLLRRLFVAAGANADDAGRMAAAIAARRNPAPGGVATGAPLQRNFRAVDELARLPGMNSRLFARLEPVVTVYSGRNFPDLSYSGPLALEVLRGVNATAAKALTTQRRARPARAGAKNGMLPGAAPGGNLVAGYGGTVLRVFASAKMADGTRGGLDATIRLALTPGTASPYKVLDWRAGSADAP